MTAPTILFQPATGAGLGHVSRLTAIAVALRARAPRARLLFATEDDTMSLPEWYDLPRVSLPRETREWSGWSPRDRANLHLALAEALIDATRPDLIVFDCFPSRAVGVAALDAGILVAICVREMREVGAYYDLVRPILDHASTIIVAHDTPESCVPPSLWHKAHCVGAIARPSPGAGVGETVDTSRPHVTITAGGGGYQEAVAFFNRAMAAIALCRGREPALTATLITGPLFTGWSALRPVTGVRLVPFVPNLLDVFAASALIMCQAGYNTIAEAACMSVPLICSPVEAPHDSQQRRAADLARRRSDVRVLGGETDEELAEWILTMLRRDREPSEIRLPPGADAAARVLLTACGALDPMSEATISTPKEPTPWF